MTAISPSRQFTHSVAANVSYWRQRCHALADHDLPAIDSDRQNLYRAAQFGLRLAETWRATAELILQLFVLVERRGYWGEWIPILERMLAQCRADDLTMRGRILDQLGIFYRYDRQLTKALSCHEEELQGGMRLEDKWRQAHACINLGVVYRLMRRYDEAEMHLLKAQKAFQAIDAPLVKHAFVTLELGLLAQARGEWSLAEKYLRDAVSLWRQVNDTVYLANGLKLLGQVLASQDKTEEALEMYHEALERLALTENHLDVSRLLNELGTVHLELGNATEALRLLQAADSSFLRQSGNLFDEAIVTNNIGNAYLAQRQLTEAEAAFRRSIALWETCEDQVQLANSLGGLAQVRVSQREIGQARELYRRARTLLAGFPDDVWGQSIREQFAKEERALNHS